MRKPSFLFFISVLFSAVLLYCTKPTAPEFENPYDTESGTYIPTPDLNTVSISNILAFEAQSGGEFETDYGKPVTQKGVCWSTNENPTLEDNCTNDGTGLEPFESRIEGLEAETEYFVRAYAKNEDGTVYGGQRSFMTLDGIAELTTSEVSSIMAFSAIVGGEITYDGGADITERGVCYSTSEIPTFEDTCVASGQGGGSFEVTLEGLSHVSQYYARAYAKNGVGLYYGNQVTFTTRDGIPAVTTKEPFDIGRTTARTGGEITDDGGIQDTENGVCYVRGSSVPNLNDSCLSGGTGLGNFEILIQNLIQEQTYSVRAYAENTVDIVWGEVYEFVTFDTQTVDVTNPATGRIWMDRNLGASRMAISSTDSEAYGDLYQWGREADGHQKRNSPTTSTLSNSDQPGHGSFILSNSEAGWDWRSPHNDNLWQGVNGANNPCPTGYRLPTEAEWNAERNSWDSNNAAGAFSSPLKLPVAGDRNRISGSLNDVGSHGRYWSSSVIGSSARYLVFHSSNTLLFSSFRAHGRSIRCLKD